MAQCDQGLKQLRGGACNPPGVGGGVLERGWLSGVSKDEEELGRQRARGRGSRQRRRAGSQGGELEAGENRILLGTADNY